MKLYRAEVVRVIYLMAEDEDEAIELAPEYADEDSQNPDVDVSPATNASIHSDHWEGALIYNPPGGEDVTAEQGLVFGDQAAIDKLKLEKWNKDMGGSNQA